MRRAAETLDHFPSIAQIDLLMAEMGLKSQEPKIVRTEAYCPDCDGLGYFIVENIEGNHMAASCEVCNRGREMASREQFPIASLSVARRAGYDIPRRAPRMEGSAG